MYIYNDRYQQHEYKINVLTYKASNYVWYETGLNGIGTKEQND